MESRYLSFRTAKFSVLFALVLVLHGIDPLKNIPRIFPAGLHTGDVVFRMGRGMFSSFFSRMGSQTVPYSHVGIYIERDGLGYVIHTEANEVTGEGYARMEPIEVFLGPQRAVSGTVFRPKGLSKEQQNTVTQSALADVERQIPFDSDFDLSTTDRLYCTELVWRVFLSAGIDLAPTLDMLKGVTIAGGQPRRIVSLNNLVESGALSFLVNIN